VPVVPYLMLTAGKSGSSWLATMLNRVQCSFNVGEYSCPVLHTELGSRNISLPPGSFFWQREKRIDGLRANWTIEPELEANPLYMNSRAAYGANITIYSHSRLYNDSASTSACRLVAEGGKCAFCADWTCGWMDPVKLQANTLFDARFAALLLSRPQPHLALPVRLVHLVRRNALDWVLAQPGFGRKHSPGKVVWEAKDLLRAVQKKLHSDMFSGTWLSEMANRLGSPYYQTYYEDLCATTDAFNRLLAFLSVPEVDVHELRQHNTAVSQGNKSKAEVRSFRERLEETTYQELYELLSQVKLSHLLDDEPCTLGMRFGAPP